MSVEGSLVVLKFYYGHKDSVNPIISKTLGRISIINYSYLGNQPQPGTFWLCRIDKERQDQFNPEHGCFIVTPIKEVPIADIVKLVPTTYDVSYQKTNVILTPKVSNFYWICPFSIKKFYIKKETDKDFYQSVIVPLTLNEST